MEVKVLGVERRRRWSDEEKARIVEETTAPGAVVCEVARRYGMSQGLLFSWRRQARRIDAADAGGSKLLPVEIADLPSTLRPPIDSSMKSSSARARFGVIEIDLGVKGRVRVDSNVDAEALRRVLDVLSGR